MAQAVISKERTVEEILAKRGLSGFAKVNEEGGTFVLAVFYNPETKEYQSVIVRDYDYFDKSRDDDELYYIPIDEDVRRIWMHDNGHILVGDLVVVEKGRNVRIGTVAYVNAIRPVYNKYHRVVNHSVYLSSGEKTYLNNIRLVNMEKGE